MDDNQTQQLFEMIEVAVPMQKRVPLTDTKRGDETIDSLAHSSSAPPETLEAHRSLYSQALAAGLENREPSKIAQYLPESLFIADALENLAENQVRQSETLVTDLTIEIIGLTVSQASKVINPYGCIHDYHRSLLVDASTTRLLQITFPLHFSAKPPNRGLCFRLYQKAQPCLDSSAFCPGAAGPHRLLHQTVVDIDVRSHLVAPMCASMRPPDVYDYSILVYRSSGVIFRISRFPAPRSRFVAAHIRRPDGAGK